MRHIEAKRAGSLRPFGWPFGWWPEGISHHLLLWADMSSLLVAADAAETQAITYPIKHKEPSFLIE